MNIPIFHYCIFDVFLFSFFSARKEAEGFTKLEVLNMREREREREREIERE